MLFFWGCSSEVKPPLPIEKNYSEQIEYVKSRVNGRYCLFVDFSIHNGKERIFLIDLNKGELLEGFSGLVAHGSGCGTRQGKPAGFSNVEGSNCSSIGLSILYSRDWSNWGVNIKYWLKGLDPTNSNMAERLVVFHSYEGIPDYEVYPSTIVDSWGCFTVSDKYFMKIDSFIQTNNLESKIYLYAFQ